MRLEPSPIVTVANRPGYRIGMEERDGHTFLHCAVTAPWSRGLKARLEYDARTIFNLHGGPLHTIAASPHAGDLTKHAKFCALLGFHPSHTVVLGDGTTRTCYTRTE